ncbi:MAG: secondary thiamine-phosphate synthase enzyme YjbQ [Ignavibacteria bacterium]|jgi:secondary thiamine-phosphate synthase enzyme
MTWIQKEIQLKPYARGFHLITSEILNKFPEIKEINAGIVHLLLKHTSASLTLNENYDPDVRKDMESFFNWNVKEDESFYVHTSEGSDDMPAHIKSTLIGTSLSIPVTNGHFNLGTWQGIYLCEHRNHGGSRKILITLQGE